MKPTTHPHRLIALGLSLLALGISDGALAADAPAGASKPNIMLILADDLGARSLGCFGGTVPTPNLDRLAREGMVFHNAHAAPMCAPTRDEMFAGLSRAFFSTWETVARLTRKPPPF